MKPEAHKKDGLRTMDAKDFPEVMAIENQYPHPSSEGKFRGAMAALSIIKKVVIKNGKVAGFMIYNLDEEKIPLKRFRVHPDHRDDGTAEMMLENLMGHMQNASGREHYTQRKSIELDVCDTDFYTLKFLTSKGFQKVETIEKPYDGADENAYRMWIGREPGQQYKPREPFSLTYLLNGFRTHLEGVTGVKWAIMKLGADGGLEECSDIPASRDRSDDFFLVTAEKIPDPQWAYEGLSDVFFDNDSPPGMRSRNNAVQQIRLPARYIKDDWLSRGREHELSKNFSRVQGEEGPERLL